MRLFSCSQTRAVKCPPHIRKLDLVTPVKAVIVTVRLTQSVKVGPFIECSHRQKEEERGGHLFSFQGPPHGAVMLSLSDLDDVTMAQSCPSRERVAVWSNRW